MTDDDIARLPLATLKELSQRIDAELGRRKMNGNEATVKALMDLARTHGWDRKKDGDVVAWMSRKVKA